MRSSPARFFPVVVLLVISLIVLQVQIASASGLFSELRITEISVKGHKLHVKGESDLPSGSLLNIKLHLPGIEDPGKAVKVHLNKHRFFIQADLPFSKDLKGKTGLLRLIFDPLLQKDSILSEVGARGENLTGPKTRQKGSVKILEEILTIKL